MRSSPRAVPAGAAAADTSVNQTLPFSSAQPRQSAHPAAVSAIDKVARPPALATGAVQAPLSAAEAQRFRDEGYLVVPELCDRAELQEIRSILLGLFEQRAGHAEGNQFDMLSLDRKGTEAIQPQIVKPSLYAPALLRTPHFRRVQAMARQLLGADAEFSFDHSILKPAGKAASTPWHQDEAHSPDRNFRHDQISFWMPLQDVSEENGCMRYVPGSNHGPVLPHRSLNDDPRIHALECPTRYFDESAALAQPVPAGWCILHGGRTLHSALPNRSAADRLVYVLAFRGPPIPRGEPGNFTWLETKRTAGIERNLHWRLHGGFLVLVLRWLRRVFRSDFRALQFKLQRLAHLRRARLQKWWRGP